MKLEFTVNGEKYSLDVDPIRRLLDVLRDDLALSGTKEGCGEGECGAQDVEKSSNRVDVEGVLLPVNGELKFHRAVSP